MSDSYCSVPKGEVLDFSTYFNSFSIEKWTKYTDIDNVRLRVNLQGSFLIQLYHARRLGGKTVSNLLKDQYVVSDGVEDVLVPFPDNIREGILYFKLTALAEESIFRGGAYETIIKTQRCANIRIAIGICTFHRETFVTNVLETLRTEILENKSSPLYGKLEIFVSDNGKTLKTDWNSEHICIFPNRNLGGAGGFTRVMLEIQKIRQERDISHILLMDDDIRLNVDSLIRTYTLLSLVKPEYKDAFVGGHMLKLDRPYIQSEAADYWDLSTHHPVKPGYDLRDFNFVIKNEIEDSVNYFSWWYCCMPVDVVSDTNLPLPLFIKRDDIEYGLRCGRKFITMNGICVWHEAFEYKYSTYLEYYYFRNMCIMNSAHRPNFTSEVLIETLQARVNRFLKTYHYRDAELSILGVQHYLKGIDWLKEQDGEKLNAEIMKLGYKKQPINSTNSVFIHDKFEYSISKDPLGRKQKIIRLLTRNGELLPPNRTVIVPAYKPDPSMFYRAAKVINYEEVSNTAFITYHNKAYEHCIRKLLKQTIQEIENRYERITEEYRARYSELTNVTFWEKYLFSNGEVQPVQSCLNEANKPKNTKYQYFVELISFVIRMLQVVLFWLPVKKNRIMIYAHERKGFACNPKYIVKKLKEKYGDKLEIIWVSMYPETCQEIKDMGIPVVLANTKRHILGYLRCRFYITNDCFPVWAIRRPGQKWLNTWHGAMNYKHIGYDYLVPKSSLGKHLFMLKNRQPNFFLSGSKFFTEDTAKSFHLDEAVFIPTGLPRNDALFEQREEIKAKIKTTYNIPVEKRLVLYAPTFRRGEKSNTYGMDFEEVCFALKKRFGGDWIVLFRNHSFVKGVQACAGAVNVSAYHDMQDLLCASDVLISDYSSCLYDFALSGRPAIVYATDLEYYVNGDRSLAYPIEKWPYPMAESNQDLLQKITEFDENAYRTAVKKHMDDVGAYDKGDASEQVAKIIEKYCI